MPPRTLRIAAAQIDYQPAYLGRSFSYLLEACLIEGTENGLSALVQFPNIADTRKRIRATWINHIQKKIEKILYFCATHRADLVVLPEYSIPFDLLPLCKDAAERHRMVIVAGSHTIAGTPEAQEAYRAAELGLNLTPSDPNSDIRKSICPVFLPTGQPQIVEKASRSVWESDMTLGRPGSSILTVNIRGTNFRIGILLCIDALRLDQLASLYAGERPDLLIVPSLSRTTAPFDSLSQLSMLNEIPTVYVNSSEYGQSKIVAKSGAAINSWPLESDGLERIPKDTEAVSIAQIDFDEQVDVRTTVRPHLGMQIVSHAPILYASQSDLCREFVEVRKRLLGPRVSLTDNDLRQQLLMLMRADSTLFPQLLQVKIRRLLDSIQDGSLRVEDLRMLVETVDMPSDVCPTFMVRQSLIQEALNKTVSLLSSPESIHEQDRILKVIRNLSKQRLVLPEGLNRNCLEMSLVASEEIKTQAREPEEKTQAFFNRQNEMNLIRAFVNSGDQRAFAVQGMKGIGKTALIRRVFVEVLPKWECIWIQVPEGISFEQLVAECAGQLGLPANEQVGREQSWELARAVLARLDSVEATAVVFDDCDNLLGPTRDFAEDDTKRFIMELVSRPSRRNSKIFVVSNASLRLTNVGQPLSLHGLEPRDGRNLLDYWIRLQREEVRGQPIDIPEKLISFLQGHPLATKIAARLCTTYGPKQLVGDLAVFKKLREEIVAVLLDKVVLADSQRALLQFGSVFRVGMPLEIFRRWGGDAAIIELDSVSSRFLLEVIAGEYWMHPAIANYFYEQTDASKTRNYHHMAGEYYLREYGRTNPKNISLLVEAVHHIAASGDIERAKALGVHKEQLRTLAKSAYGFRDWELSLRYYEAIIQIDPKDIDALSRLALLNGHLARWREGDIYFDRATVLKPGQWLYQGYGSIKVNAGLLIEGENLLMHALELNDRDSATLASLAVLRLRQSREYEAEKLFKEALECNAENSFALSHYARFLINHGRKAEAKPYAELLVELEPRNPHARDLLRQASESPATRTPA